MSKVETVLGLLLSGILIFCLACQPLMALDWAEDARAEIAQKDTSAGDEKEAGKSVSALSIANEIKEMMALIHSQRIQIEKLQSKVEQQQQQHGAHKQGAWQIVF